MYEIINYGEKLKKFLMDQFQVEKINYEEVSNRTGYSTRQIGRYINEKSQISLEVATVFIVSFKLPSADALVFLNLMGFWINNLYNKFDYPFYNIINNLRERNKIANDYQHDSNNISPKNYVKKMKNSNK